MRISQRTWTQYITALRKINDAAYKAMKKYLDTYGLPSEDWEEDALIDIATAVARKYGAASATLSAEFYDKIGRLAGRTLPAALPAEAATVHEVAKAVVGTAKTGNPDIVAGAVSRLVKQHAQVHVIMTENAAKFISPITFETLTGRKCITDTFDRNHPIP